MALPQLNIRIPPHIDERFKTHATRNGTTKTEVVLSALALYLDCAEDVPLREKVAVIEERLAALEAEVHRVQTMPLMER
ncbi:MAG: hypothetical protein F6K47_19970 [Symploca sp. SIO2E6]|nr:hypothetical protein [Symploca sp. SIO2E6]